LLLVLLPMLYFQWLLLRSAASLESRFFVRREDV
jgi:hypothetical protein